MIAIVTASVAIDVARPIQEVFDHFVDIRNEADWDHGHVHAIRKITDGPIRLGTTFIGRHARSALASWCITAYEPPHRVRIEGRIGRGTYSYEGRFEATSSGTRMSGTIAWEPSTAFRRVPFLALLLRARARRSLRRFAEHVQAMARPRNAPPAPALRL